MLLKWYPTEFEKIHLTLQIYIVKLLIKKEKKKSEKEAYNMFLCASSLLIFSFLITCDILNETKKVSFKLTVTKLDDKKTSSPLQTVMEFFLFHSKANRINLYEIVQKSFEPVTLTRVKINLVTI